MAYDEIAGKRPGRNKIIYNPAEMERPRIVTVVCGMQEIGKTHESLKDIDNYVLDNPNTGKIGEKVLVVDFSLDASYARFKPVNHKYIRNLTEPRVRRIVPFDDNGQKYGIDEMRKTAEYVVFNFRRGLLVMDDIDKYMAGKKGQSLIGAMTTVRHDGGFDLLITHQSLTKVSKTELENASYLRLHHQLDDVDLIKNDISNYPLMKIAQLIVDKRYFDAERDYAELGTLTEQEYKKRRSFFVYIDMKRHKIIGCTQQDFDEGVMKFIRLNPGLINKRIKIGDEFGRRLDRDGAMKSLYKDYSYFMKK